MVESDTQLMCDFNIMDYSLLFAIEKVPRQLRKVRGTSLISGDMMETSSNAQLSENIFKGSQDDNSSKLSALGKRHRYLSTCGKYIYHMAIIDYLQEFNLEKWGESRLKIWVLRRPPTLISAVDPDLYRKRFIQFMKTEVLIERNLFLSHECFQELNTKFTLQYQKFKSFQPNKE